MPKHTHSFSGSSNVKVPNGSTSVNNDYANSRVSVLSSTGTSSVSISGTTGSTGSGTAHNNMPPYIVVSIWKRIE